jgi:hypothetical protein
MAEVRLGNNFQNGRRPEMQHGSGSPRAQLWADCASDDAIPGSDCPMDGGPLTVLELTVEKGRPALQSRVHFPAVGLRTSGSLRFSDAESTWKYGHLFLASDKLHLYP